MWPSKAFLRIADSILGIEARNCFAASFSRRKFTCKLHFVVFQNFFVSYVRYIFSLWILKKKSDKRTSVKSNVQRRPTSKGTAKICQSYLFKNVLCKDNFIRF